MKKDIVLFDFDGTLMDTNQLVLDSWKYAFRKLRGEVPPDEVLYATFGEILADTVREFFGGSEEDVRRNVAIYREYHNEHFQGDILLFDGVEEMLRALRDRGYRLGLVTSRLKSTTMQGLDKFGITDLFEALVTADDTTAHKPDPGPIDTALAMLGAAPARAVMVGDTWMDMECARRAGVTPIMVNWSIAWQYNRAPEDMGKPAWVVQNPAELVSLLDERRF